LRSSLLLNAAQAAPADRPDCRAARPIPAAFSGRDMLASRPGSLPVVCGGGSPSPGPHRRAARTRAPDLSAVRLSRTSVGIEAGLPITCGVALTTSAIDMSVHTNGWRCPLVAASFSPQSGMTTWGPAFRAACRAAARRRCLSESCRCPPPQYRAFTMLFAGRYDRRSLSGREIQVVIAATGSPPRPLPPNWP